MPVVSGFDQVFLALVENVTTNQDREDAIIELQSFIVSLSTRLGVQPPG